MSDFMSDFTGKTTYNSNYYLAGFNDNGIRDGENIKISLPNLIGIVQSQLVYSTPITVLTGSFGTTGDAISDVTASFDQTILNNNFRALEDKVNAIHAALLNAGLITTS